jgi:hypothetical protein
MVYHLSFGLAVQLYPSTTKFMHVEFTLHVFSSDQRSSSRVYAQRLNRASSRAGRCHGASTTARTTDHINGQCQDNPAARTVSQVEPGDVNGIRRAETAPTSSAVPSRFYVSCSTVRTPAEHPCCAIQSSPRSPNDLPHPAMHAVTPVSDTFLAPPSGSDH